MNRSNILIENAQIQFRNFSGKEGKFNPEGRRNFCVFLEMDVAKTLEKDGWNIRWLDPRDEGDDPVPYMQVAVSYEKIIPRIVIVTKRGQTLLNEDTVGMVDWAEIEKVDLTINPSSWTMHGKSGVKAYIRSMFITLVEDKLEEKYSNVPDSAIDSIGGCGNCETCDGTCGCNHDHDED